MKAIWLDAQLPPQAAQWLRDTFTVDALAIREVGLRDAGDVEIFNAARSENAILISKDIDFVDLVARLGSPPKLIWLTCGNVSNTALQEVFKSRFLAALNVLESDDIVELG